jgi:hypothetical protein
MNKTDASCAEWRKVNKTIYNCGCWAVKGSAPSNSIHPGNQPRKYNFCSTASEVFTFIDWWELTLLILVISRISATHDRDRIAAVSSTSYCFSSSSKHLLCGGSRAEEDTCKYLLCLFISELVHSQSHKPRLFFFQKGEMKWKLIPGKSSRHIIPADCLHAGVTWQWKKFQSARRIRGD